MKRIIFISSLPRSGTTLLGARLPQTKLICCVRSVNAILESFERVFRENLLETSAMFGFDPEINVYGRVDRLMVPGGVVGVALNGLKEAFYGPDSDRMLLVGYDRLATAPKLTLEAIYDFIGEPIFAHDFANVGFAAQDFDAAFGMNGLHTGRGTVARITRQKTLPPDLSALFQAPEFRHAPDKTSKATCRCEGCQSNGSSSPFGALGHKVSISACKRLPLGQEDRAAGLLTGCRKRLPLSRDR